MYRNLFFLALFCVLTFGGCGRSAEDRVVLNAEEGDRVFASGNGPEDMMIIWADVPPAIYRDGVLHLTNGREVRIIPPSQWSTYTGQGMTVEDAEQRAQYDAEMLASLQDLSEAVTALRALVDEEKGSDQ